MGRKEEVWKEHYRSLLKFVEREGHCRVPSRHVENNFNLGRWVHGQRMNRDKMPKYRVRALEAVHGWHWSGQQAKWNRACAALESFIEQRGHSRVPKLHVEHGFKLGIWVMHQRESFKTGTLSRERKEFLEKHEGWDWYGEPNRLPDANIDEFAEAVWGVLFGRGPVGEVDAFNILAPALYDMGLTKSFAVQWNSPVGDTIRKSMNRAMNLGYLDKPSKTAVRAVLKDSEDYVQDDWNMCLDESIGIIPVKDEDAIEDAALWAKENLGLKFQKVRPDTPIWNSLDKSIHSLLQKKVIKRHGQTDISKPS